MALVTLQRSPSGSSSPSPVVQDEEPPKRGRLQKRESFVLVKGAALLLQDNEDVDHRDVSPTLLSLMRSKSSGSQQRHLQSMLELLRPEDQIRLAVRLESVQLDRIRYLVIVTTSANEDENILLGMDFPDKEKDICTIGLVLPIWSDTQVYLDGDGGFSVTTSGQTLIFKPISVQTMWSVLQVLHKTCQSASIKGLVPGGCSLDWAKIYEANIESDRICINEWHMMSDLESVRPDSCFNNTSSPSEREQTQQKIRSVLRKIMSTKDLECITSKEIRSELELLTGSDMREHREFIDNEMMIIMAQMDKPSKIFDYLFLGSEWNAANWEELQRNKVGHILNVTREIDNFFPESIKYYNVRVYDDETTDLLSHWNNTYQFIKDAWQSGSNVLVHCKMGVSRSASTVIAFAMKQYSWSLEQALKYVKEKRGIVKPNPAFMKQLATYEGILDASKQRHNLLWKRRSQEMQRRDREDRGSLTDTDDEEESKGLGLADSSQGGFVPVQEHFYPEELWVREKSLRAPEICVEDLEQEDFVQELVKPASPSLVLDSVCGIQVPLSPKSTFWDSRRMNLSTLMRSISEMEEEEQVPAVMERKAAEDDKESSSFTGKPHSPEARKMERIRAIQRKQRLVHQKPIDHSPEPRSNREQHIQGQSPKSIRRHKGGPSPRHSPSTPRRQMATADRQAEHRHKHSPRLYQKQKGKEHGGSPKTSRRHRPKTGRGSAMSRKLSYQPERGKVRRQAEILETHGDAGDPRCQMGRMERLQSVHKLKEAGLVSKVRQEITGLCERDTSRPDLGDGQDIKEESELVEKDMQLQRQVAEEDEPTSSSTEEEELMEMEEPTQTGGTVELQDNCGMGKSEDEESDARIVEKLKELGSAEGPETKPSLVDTSNAEEIDRNIETTVEESPTLQESESRCEGSGSQVPPQETTTDLAPDQIICPVPLQPSLGNDTETSADVEPSTNVSIGEDQENEAVTVNKHEAAVD
uniref:protein-serine/threonine phosphatase n=1 Tax=Erpetoichthys calabaricus TaxID=27687 RepID=A0A8C4X9V1_ERPCA